ncbi:MAG TPA: AsmA family protein [Wenzhouxiangellaceae bacterium]|nr:AsmA family protein [Wenzhouxiangellaceae bacterium]
MRALLIFLAAIVVIILGLWATLVLYFDEARLKQIAIEQVRAQTGRELQIDGPLTLDIFPRISLVANDVKLSGPEDFEGPNLFEADELRISLSILPLLRGEIETGDIGLDNARLAIHTDRAGRNSLDGLTGAAEAGADGDQSSQGQPSVSTGNIALSRARLTVSDDAADARQVFVVERMEVKSFAFDRPVNFEFAGGIGDPAIVEDIDVAGTLTVPSDAGPIVVQEFGMTAEASGLPLGLSGRATLDPGPPLTARFEEGLLNLNGKQFETSFTYRDTKQPSIEALLKGEMLNVDALLAVMPGGEEAAEDIDDEESPLLLFKAFDVDARLELERAIVSGLELDNVRARLRSVQGVVTIDPLSGGLPGGRVDAVVVADLNTAPPLVQIDPVFDLESLGTALSAWNLDQFITGAGILELGLSAKGLDVDAILSTLNGRGKYDFHDGSIKGLNLDGMVEGLSSRNIAEAVRTGVGGTTEFRALEGAISIEDGTIRLPGINIITDLLGITGDVRIGISDLALNGQVRLEGEQLNRIPIGLEGTLTKPKLVPDVGEALKEEAGRRVMDFLEKRATREEESEEGGNGG